jgi:hypothetical protein
MRIVNIWKERVKTNLPKKDIMIIESLIYNLTVKNDTAKRQNNVNVKDRTETMSPVI